MLALLLRRKSRRWMQNANRRQLLGEMLEDRRLLAGLVNGDFETGDLTGWTSFISTNGTLGSSEVVAFDTKGDRVRTQSASFRVGQQVFQNGIYEGGGIFQTFDATGQIEISADIASRATDGNQSGGRISLLIDGNVVDTHDFGEIGRSQIERSTLNATLTVTPGSHEIRILITRPFLQASFTPYQYLDNIVITGGNLPPEASDDLAATFEDSAVLVDVAANDSDPDGNLNASSAVATSSPANGSLVNHNDGTFTYTPNPDFHGPDSFTYQIADTDGEVSTATVHITVNPVVDIQNDVASVDEDNSVAIDVISNDDFEDLGAAVTSVTQGANGVVSINPDGTVTYTPNLNFHGSDSFTYTVTTAGSSTTQNTETATVNVTVNSVIDAMIDVKPGNGSEVDPINLGSNGKTPIAILSTQTSSGEPDDFNATLVDLALITFQVNGEDITPDKIKIEDVDGDGDADLLLHFLTQDLAAILTENSVALTLTAKYGGAAIGQDLGGTDAIKIVPNKGKK